MSCGHVVSARRSPDNALALTTLRAMTARLADWSSPDRDPIPEKYTWFSIAWRLVGVPAMALLWWAVAFLPWTRPPLTVNFQSWPPTLPVLFTDLEVAVFGPLGASLVVVALLRRAGLAFLSILLGLVVPALVTLTRGADTHGNVFNPTQRYVMLGVGAIAAFVGLAIGAAAIRSLKALGFFALLAVDPAVSLIAVLLLDPRADRSWLTRLALAVLLVLIAWRRWSGVLVWPIFFALFWLLNLVRSALGHGAQTLRHHVGGQDSTGVVTDAMASFISSAWRVALGTSWDIFWPAAVIAALVIAGQRVWRRDRQPQPTGGQPA